MREPKKWGVAHGHRGPERSSCNEVLALRITRGSGHVRGKSKGKCLEARIF